MSEQVKPRRRGDLDDETRAKIDMMESIFSNSGALAIDVAQRTDIAPSMVAEGCVNGMLRTLVILHNAMALSKEEEDKVIADLVTNLKEAYEIKREGVLSQQSTMMQTLGLKAPENARVQ